MTVVGDPLFFLHGLWISGTLLCSRRALTFWTSAGGRARRVAATLTVAALWKPPLTPSSIILASERATSFCRPVFILVLHPWPVKTYFQGPTTYRPPKITCVKDEPPAPATTLFSPLNVNVDERHFFYQIYTLYSENVYISKKLRFL